MLKKKMNRNVTDTLLSTNTRKGQWKQVLGLWRIASGEVITQGLSNIS